MKDGLRSGLAPSHPRAVEPHPHEMEHRALDEAAQRPEEGRGAARPSSWVISFASSLAPTRAPRPASQPVLEQRLALAAEDVLGEAEHEAEVADRCLPRWWRCLA